MMLAGLEMHGQHSAEFGNIHSRLLQLLPDVPQIRNFIFSHLLLLFPLYVCGVSHAARRTNARPARRSEQEPRTPVRRKRSGRHAAVPPASGRRRSGNPGFRSGSSRHTHFPPGRASAPRSPSLKPAFCPFSDRRLERTDTFPSDRSATPPLLPEYPLLSGDDTHRAESGEDRVGLADQGGDGVLAFAFLNRGDGLGGSAAAVVDQIADGITGDEFGGEAVRRVEQDPDRFGFRIGGEDCFAQIMVGPGDEGGFLGPRVPIDGCTGRNLPLGLGDVENSDNRKASKRIGFNIKSGDSNQIGYDNDVSGGNVNSGAVIDGVALLYITGKHYFFLL
nr:MAG TPA: hypothetical protein [Caudoviricetes sp.]